MLSLTREDIELISHDIQRQEITFSHLPDDLLDHLCCDVEEEMAHGLEFPDAYALVKQKFGPDRFRDIQKEILFEVDNKYRIMKNLMKFSGVAGTILFGIAALFKIQHWPMAGIMMTVGAFIITLLFLPSALNVLWKETHNKYRLFLFISAFLTGLFLVCGTLFKIQHWPLAGMILLSGLFVTVFMFIPSLLLYLFSDKERTMMRPFYLTLSAGIALFLGGLLFRIQHFPFGTLLIVSGTIILGFIVLPWLARIRWKNEENVSIDFLFLVIALLLIIIPGMLIKLNSEGINSGDMVKSQINASYSPSENSKSTVPLDKIVNPK